MDKLICLETLERKVLWLSAWMVHHANHLRANTSGIKIGGHQASCASVTTILSALYFDVLQPQDRVAIKPHAAPVFHAIQYLLGAQTKTQLQNFRALGGAQAYPSRTKDSDDVDISTGSVGLGVAMTTFLSLTQDYLRLKHLMPSSRSGRMIALAGDAELDEGNVYEALFEGWKHEVRNLWWIIDYNRHSLDGVISDQLLAPIQEMFRSMGWRVEVIKYGKLQQKVFDRPDGQALREWIHACPNARYSDLTFQGGKAWRQALSSDLGDLRGIRTLLEQTKDTQLHQIMTNLGGHDMSCLLEAFHTTQDDTPTCFIAYTIKGKGLPFEGHEENHAGLMNRSQMDTFRQRMGIAAGEEWEPLAGLPNDSPHLASPHSASSHLASPAELRAFIPKIPFRSQGSNRSFEATPVPVPLKKAGEFHLDFGASRTNTNWRGQNLSTQAGFGTILKALAESKSQLAERIVTVSPDVASSTNLGDWITKRNIFHAQARKDEATLKVIDRSTSPDGQHLGLGIAENNLFVALAALGLSAPIFGTRLLPIGTLYDPFIRRGLDAFHYACYSDARFMVVATPSGITLAPEGGAHQSTMTPLIGISQPGLLAFEPAYVDELATIMAWGFRYLQEPEGSSLYLRLSTRPLQQPDRQLTPELQEQILAGAYWHHPPAPGASLAIIASGAVLPEAQRALAIIHDDLPGAGLLVITSSDALYSDWFSQSRHHPRGGQASHIAKLLQVLDRKAALVSVIDGHPLTLSWLASVNEQHLVPLGVTTFGQSGSIEDLYRQYGIDAEAILEAAARATWRRLAS